MMQPILDCPVTAGNLKKPFSFLCRVLQWSQAGQVIVVLRFIASARLRLIFMSDPHEHHLLQTGPASSFAVCSMTVTSYLGRSPDLVLDDFATMAPPLFSALWANAFRDPVSCEKPSAAIFRSVSWGDFS